MNKKCATCAEIKALDHFHISGKGYRPDCKKCRAAKDRNDKLMRHYNISLETYDTLLRKQGGSCYVCKGPEKALNKFTNRAKYLAVDHDHSCCPGTKTCGDCIRGLLCSRCNVLMGLAEDNAELLLNCIVYLKNWEYNDRLQPEPECKD